MGLYQPIINQCSTFIELNGYPFLWRCTSFSNFTIQCILTQTFTVKSGMVREQILRILDWMTCWFFKVRDCCLIFVTHNVFMLEKKDDMENHIACDVSLFPVSTILNSRGNLEIAGHDLYDLAVEYGTPLYLYDGATISEQLSSIRQNFSKYYAGEALIAYAAKACFSLGLAKKLAKMGAGVDVVSRGEIQMARIAGFEPDGVHLHGNNKSQAELQAALDWGVQAIVVDSLDELAFLETLAARSGTRARIWLRITPDLEVNTHRHIETSHAASKFGLHTLNGQAAEAIQRARSSRWLNLVGLHTHLGSQLFDTAPYRSAIETLYQVAEQEDFIPQEFSPGGGWGVRYTLEDPDDSSEPWVRAVSESVQEQCKKRNWPLPRLVLESGRWLVARGGVALYTVGAQKDTPEGIHITAVDGGMADNPRNALYGAHYSAYPVHRPGRQRNVRTMVAGKFCESGDVLIPEVVLPIMQRGEILAIPTSGAYQLSMSSNYNLADRPAVLWLEDDKVEILQHREIPEASPWWMGKG